MIRSTHLVSERHIFRSGWYLRNPLLIVGCIIPQFVRNQDTREAAQQANNNEGISLSPPSFLGTSASETMHLYYVIGKKGTPALFGFLRTRAHDGRDPTCGCRCQFHVKWHQLGAYP